MVRTIADKPHPSYPPSRTNPCEPHSSELPKALLQGGHFSRLGGPFGVGVRYCLRTPRPAATAAPKISMAPTAR
jgi:hypothetical protein